MGITAKEKAKELIDKYFQLTHPRYNMEKAKKDALKEVDQIDISYQEATPKDNPYYFLMQFEFLGEVKQEIENF